MLSSAARGQTGYFGTAKVNINPSTPVMLSGYAGRSSYPEATVVQQNIVAQAAVFGAGADASILFTVDCTGVPDNVVDPVKQRLSNSLGIAPERIVITCTHSHSCPHVSGYLPNLFDPPLSNQEQQHVNQYTHELTQKLEEAALAAVTNRTPGHEISWANGSVGFAANRRGSTQVDHDLPVMLVRDALGQAKAIITSYATHAVTFDNVISGDWPGYAREAIETLYPGVAAMVMIGAGADSNPVGVGSWATAQAQGQSIANEVERLISQGLMKPVSQDLSVFHSEIELDYATARLPGDPLSARLAPAPASTLYGVTSWTFGKDLAMVFMEGEVVVDYSLRLKEEFGDKLWVNGYSNDVQGYIPSERILYEGGYEPDSSGHYYGLPGRFAHGLEDKIVGAVHQHLDEFGSIADRLRLVVDWGTGAISVANLGDETVTLDAYSIVSAAGALDPADNRWQSLQDQALAGWDEADNSNASRLTEFNPVGSTTLTPGTLLNLGTPLTVTPPTKFGDPFAPAALAFEYSVPGEGTVKGTIDGGASGGPHNNLVLTIDPDTGAAAIQNESPFFDVSITAYTIASTDGALLTANDQWSSLQDQGLAGWDEADNASEFRITEFKTAGATLLEGGGMILTLGAPLDVSGAAPELSDLSFQFLLSTGEVMDGVVQYGALPGTIDQGDYDADGDVDGADFLVWQRTLGSTASPPGSSADGNDDGIVNAGDLAVWKSGFGNVGTTSPMAAVPEPAAAYLAVGLLAVFTAVRRPRG